MLLLATEIWRSHGGIQRYMRMIARILVDHGDACAILTFLDRVEDRPSEFSNASTVCSSGNKWRFCGQALQMGRAGVARETIVGHVSLLPLAWMLKAIGFTDRYILVLHGIESWRRLSWMYRFAARGASGIVATARYTVREFCFHNGLSTSNVAVIPLACTVQSSTKRRAAPAGSLRLLTLSRLSASDAYKGIDTILRALRHASDRGLKLTLDLVGDGNDRPRLEKLAHSLDVEHLVRFQGTASDGELERFFIESDVFVMPSKKEGFGIVFLEAMSAGLPCIGGNHGGTPEVIIHGESGFLIEYGDVDQLVFYLQSLLDSAPLYERMSQAASVRARGTLSFKAMADAWRAALPNLLRDTRTVVNDEDVVAATKY